MSINKVVNSLENDFKFMHKVLSTHNNSDVEELFYRDMMNRHNYLTISALVEDYITWSEKIECIGGDRDGNIYGTNTIKSNKDTIQ